MSLRGVWATAGHGNGTKASVTDNRRSGRDPPQGLPLRRPILRVHDDGQRKWQTPAGRSPKASGALDVATKKFQIAVFPHDFGAHDDAVDALSQRRICPFDRGNVASPRSSRTAAISR